MFKRTDVCSTAQKILNLAGITEFEHLCLSDLGFEKGNSSVSEEGIEKSVNARKKLLKKEEVEA